MSSFPVARIGVWNSDWAGPRSPRRKRIIAKLIDLRADILCVTEGYRHLLPAQGSVVESDPDCCYSLVEGRRKVLLWSRHDWVIVDQLGSSRMPGGRFVSGVTETSLGWVTVLGVCIPSCYVTTGSRNRDPYQDHLAYLAGFREVLLQHQGQPVLVVGDFNQAIPRRRQPRGVFRALESALDGLVKVVTAGLHPELDRPLVDHVASSNELEPVSITVLSRFDDDGKRLSDRHGVVAELRLRSGL